ncbi:MAG: cobyric acid synthase [Tissierellia bacterium]|nr:cobyric acid synthase [Tissierellia bacterium]
MVQGTASSVGKSLMCAGLCRIFKEDGYRVFPFKSQNMSSKFYITEEGKKISTAQTLQAIAAGLKPSHHMNPILLIPKSDTGSMVVIDGEDTEKMGAREYFNLRPRLREFIREKYEQVSRENQIVVIEGAGSPAEINLKEDDIVNMGMAEIADASVLLVTDIDRGGAFASLYGTVMLLEPHERARIKGLIINKFRGDKSLLEPGIKMIEDLLKIPVVGVIPYVPLDLVEEDSLMERDRDKAMDFLKLDRELNKLAQVLRENLDMEYIYSLLGVEDE